MPLSKLYYINTGKDGLLDGTSEQDLDAMFDLLKTQEKIAVHFHGGLVSLKAGLEGAARLKTECYDGSGAHPVFFVWESGLIEVIQHNFGEIFGEDIFKILLKWVLKYASAKMEAGGAKSPLMATPSDMEIYRELAKLDANAEPFAAFKADPALSEITETEGLAFRAELEGDADLQETVQAIVNAVLPEVEAAGAKGITTRTRRSARTLMSPEVVEELAGDAADAKAGGKAKGILSTAALIRKAAVILARVVRRFMQKRDHGLYPTVVEEILREFYVANIGTAVWAAMKKETFDTFQPGGPARGGEYFTRKLSDLLVTGRRPEITLVGHSTGAVFINNLLARIRKMQEGGARPIPADFKFKNILFLAPACTFEHFLPTATTHRDLFERFRMFTMTDPAESNDSLVPGIYTRSLLYFISGVLEPGDNGGVAFDKPVLGMQRYHARAAVYPSPEVKAGRDFVAAAPQGVVWSPAASPWPPGLGSTSLKHGDFDNDPPTLESVRLIIKNS